MASELDALRTALAAAASRHDPGRFPQPPAIEELARLTGGAANETWRFDAVAGGERVACILRRTRGGAERGVADMGAGERKTTKRDEARLQQAAAGAGVPVAAVRFILAEDDGLGDGYVMERLEGESIARRILRDAEYARARERMAYQCGEILARIHGLAREALPELRTLDARAQLEQNAEAYRRTGQPVPVFDLALRWLEERVPEPRRLTLVHGDFRNGNFMVGPEGIRAVLDWEGAHVGDPMEDLGWICVPSWRFGELDRLVGGFGSREAMFEGYEAAGGGRVDPETVRFWEVLGTLRWGVICMMMTRTHLEGHARSVELAAIGRRVSETELDLLELLAPER